MPANSEASCPASAACPPAARRAHVVLLHACQWPDPLGRHLKTQTCCGVRLPHISLLLGCSVAKTFCRKTCSKQASPWVLWGSARDAATLSQNACSAMRLTRVCTCAATWSGLMDASGWSPSCRSSAAGLSVTCLVLAHSGHVRHQAGSYERLKDQALYIWYHLSSYANAGVPAGCLHKCNWHMMCCPTPGSLCSTTKP